jgi:dipeptidyl aminopeptidase/acylaminoacyl peptidase
MRVRKRRRPTVLRIALTVAVALVVAYFSVSIYAGYKLTRPVRRPLKTTPTQYGLTYEDVSFNSTIDNTPLKGWFVNPQGKPTVVVMHGSDSNRANYINMEVSKALVEHGYSVFLFDFRGQGESGGDTGGLGEWETRDVAGALAYLKTRGITQVGALGYSMGAATELLAAPNQPEMRAIVADSSFADLLSMINQERESMSAPDIFNPGVIFAARTLFGLDILADSPKQAVARLGDRPVLLIHATGDGLIPPSQAVELQQAGAADPNLQLWLAPATGHVAAFADNKQEYLNRVMGFFDKYLR